MMIYLMMSDQTYREIPEAISACVESGQVVCNDRLGSAIATFDARLVTAYGTNQALRNPAAQADPIGMGIRREREMTEAPLSSPRMAPVIS